MLSAKNQFIDPNLVLARSSKPITVFKNQVGGLLSNPEHLYIDISHKHFQKLAYKRDVAFIMGRLIVDEEDFVPAQLRAGTEQLPIKLRLKGDFTDHLIGSKWSFRIKVKDDNVLYGMEEFSIQHPKTRNYLAEWVYHEALRREDIIALRYDFVEVTVNGKNQGIFAIEEHFNSKLIENNNRRAGPIIRISEDQMWEQHDQHLLDSKPLASSEFNASVIDAFESKAIAADSVYEQQFIRAISLLEALRTGEMRTRDVFDIKKLANYLAITELMGAQHSTIWNHMRFYYNPIVGKLEPIGFDGNAGSVLPVVTATMNEYEAYNKERREIFYYASLDPIFRKAYRTALHRISRPSYLESLFQEIEPELDHKLSVIHKSYPEYTFSYEVFEKNRKHIYHVINPTDGLRVHVKEQKRDTLILQVGSTQSLPVRFEGIHIPSGDIVPIKQSSLLPGRKIRKGIVFSEFHEPIPKGVALTDSILALSKASYRIPGVDSLFYVPILPYPYSQKEIIENDLLRKGATDNQFAFLTRNDTDRKITGTPGYWDINKNLVTPEGYALELPAGTTLDLKDGAAIIVRGPLQFAGTASRPIRLVSTDSTGQGLLVLNAEDPSEVTHTEFVGLRNLNQLGWTQTGSVTFHESAITLNHVSFKDNLSEDALNIVRTSYEMNNAHFSHVHSDAFDGDFTDGIIKNSVFEGLGNDGIDVSGSTLSFQNVRIQGAGDKALSAGEFSIIEGEDLEITESEIAIASKDKSVVTLTRVDISDSRLGVTLFQKKPEFGPASLEANDYVIRNTDVPSLIEQGSLFLVNGERIPANNTNVSDLLYGNLYGTASK